MANRFIVLLMAAAIGACGHARTVEGTGFVAIDGDTLRGPAGERLSL